MKSDVWDVRFIENKLFDNHVFARQIKIKGYVFLPEYTSTLWVDANIQILTSDFSEFEKSKFLTMKHPSRDNIIDEVSACAKFKKANKDVLDKQLESYFNIGVFRPLYATGIMFRENNYENELLALLWFLRF